jgi:hypothetical protein
MKEDIQQHQHIHQEQINIYLFDRLNLVLNKEQQQKKNIFPRVIMLLSFILLSSK